MPRSTTKFDGVPISPPVFITASNNRGVKKLYPVFKDKKTDAHLLQCEECGRFISLPGNRSLVRMEKHIRSQECSRAKTKQERWRVEEQVRAEASAALAASGLQHKALPTKALSRAVKSVPIVQAQSLVPPSGPISFSISLNSSSSQYENVIQFDASPNPPPVPSIDPRPGEGSRSRSFMDSRNVGSATHPTSEGPSPGPRLHSPSPSTLSSHSVQRPHVSRAQTLPQDPSTASELSSDESEDGMDDDWRRRRSRSMEESDPGPELSDTEVENIRRRVHAHGRRSAA